MFSFSIGKDSTIIIQDHKQHIKTEELGERDYTIKLAYLISFGVECMHAPSPFLHACTKRLYVRTSPSIGELVGEEADFIG